MMITKGKSGTLHARRQVGRWLPDRAHVRKLFDEIAPRFADRPGGYTRIIKTRARLGDGGDRDRRRVRRPAGRTGCRRAYNWFTN